MSLHPPNLPRGETFPPSPSYSLSGSSARRARIYFSTAVLFFVSTCAIIFQVWAQAGLDVNVPGLIHVRAEMSGVH